MHRTVFASLLLLFLAFFSLDVQAAINNSGLFDDVLARYASAAAGWAGVIITAASRLFWALAAISMVWTFGFMALRKADIGEFFAEFIRFTIFTGFFWWLLINGPNFGNSIFASMRQLAGEATSLGNNLSPSGIVDIGFFIFNRTVNSASGWHPVDAATTIVMSGIILIALALIGVNMFLLLASAWLLAYAGVFFLGFGGSRWTSDIAISYYKTVLGIAAQLFSMVLLVGIGKTFLDDYFAQLSASPPIGELAVMLVVAVTLLVLVNKVPPLIAGIIGGGATHIGNYGAAAGLGFTGAALGMSVAAAASGAAALASGGASAGGGVSAVKAAIQKANENMAAGTGMFTEAGGGSKGAGSGGTGPSGSGNTALSDAMGSVGGMASTAGRFAADVTANLVKGGASVGKAKGANLMANATQHISEKTFGGQIASAIRKGDEGNDTHNKESQLPSDGGSLAAGNPGTTPQSESSAATQGGSMNDEVAAFVNKKSS
jgi:type IV secretion system protein TrbL